MNSDFSPQPPSPAERNADSVRRQVVDVATELMRGASDGAAPGTIAAAGAGHAMDSSGQSAVHIYLALLLDRLPIFARSMMELANQVGKASVEKNLVTAARATVQFYGDVLSAKCTVFTQPDQIVQLRRALKTHGLGPHEAHQRVCGYLEEERRLGRIPSDADCDASAHLLVGACVNYAFTKMLLEDVEPRESFVQRVVKGLRLTT